MFIFALQFAVLTVKAFVLCSLNILESSSLWGPKSGYQGSLYNTHVPEGQTWRNLPFPRCSENPQGVLRCSHSNQVVVCHSSHLSPVTFVTSHYHFSLWSIASYSPENTLRSCWNHCCSPSTTSARPARAETTLEQLENFTKVMSILGEITLQIIYTWICCSWKETTVLRPSLLIPYYATSCSAVCGLAVLKVGQAI